MCSTSHQGLTRGGISWDPRIQHVSDTVAAPQSPDSGSPVERPSQRDSARTAQVTFRLGISHPLKCRSPTLCPDTRWRDGPRSA